MQASVARQRRQWRRWHHYSTPPHHHQPHQPHHPGGAAHTHLQAGASRGAEVLVQGHVGPAKQMREGPGPTRENWEGVKFGAKKGQKIK